jgi:hypothetical protein
LLAVAFFLLTVLLGLLSDGAYHDDDLAHFQMARWARWFPEYLLHFWGRPGATVPMAAVAWIGDASVGWHAARILSALVTAAAALIAASLAARLGLRRPWLVVLACYLQPFNTLLASTTLTENYAALCLVLAVAAFHRGRPILGSLVFSLVLVTRHEAIALWPVWAIAVVTCRPRSVGPPWPTTDVDSRSRMWPTETPNASPRGACPLLPCSRRHLALAASVAAPLLHNLLFRVFLGDWPVRMFFLPRGSTEFVPAGILSYVPQALLAVPPVIAALALIGTPSMLRRSRWLIPALCAVFFLTHAASKAFGLFASGGYARFMATVAPLIAILATAGVGRMADAIRRRRNVSWLWLVHIGVWLLGLLALEIEVATGRTVLQGVFSIQVIRICVAMFLLILAMGWAVSAAWPNMPPDMRLGSAAAVLHLVLLGSLLQCYQVVRPLKLNDQARQIRQVLTWLKSQNLDSEPIFSANPWVAYFEDWVEMPRVHKGPALLASMPVGSVVIWDSIYSPSDFHRLPLRSIAGDPAYKELRRFHCAGGRDLKVRVFRKIAPTPLPANAEEPYPPNLMDDRRPPTGAYYTRP